MKWEDILKINRQKEMPFSARLMGSLFDPTVNIEFFTESESQFLANEHQALIVRRDDELYDRLGMGKNERGGIDFGISGIIGQFVRNREELNQFIEEHGDYAALIDLRGSRLEFIRMPNPDSPMGFVEIPLALRLTLRDRARIINNPGMYDLPPPTLISGSEILYQDFIDVYEQLEADL